MAVDTSGQWWKGDVAEDIEKYLRAYASKGYEVDAFRLASCQCGSKSFHLFADDNEEVAKRFCAACGEAHYICDSQKYWTEQIAAEACICECGSRSHNVGVGFSLYADKEAIRWIYVGVRCVTCGTLACFAGWKIGYTPSLQFIARE